MLKLDVLDRKLLYHLDHGARLSYSELARMVKRGRDTVEYRVKRLEDLGVITGYHAVVNPYKFGLTLFKNYLRLANDRERIKRFISLLKKERSVYWIVECGGNWDLIFSIAAESAYEFALHQQEILRGIADLIIEIAVYPVIAYEIFRLKYLHQAGTHLLLVGGPPAKSQLDSLDKKLLKLLSLNAREPVVNLAEICNVTPITVQNRIERLKKEEIISGYKAVINLAALDMTLFKAMIFQRVIKPAEDQRLFNFCNKHPNITEFITQIGNCKQEIEIHARNYENYNEIVDELRARFPSLINNVIPVVLYNEYYQWGLQPSSTNTP